MSFNSRICVVVRKRPIADTDKDIVETPSPCCIVNEPKIKYDLTPYTDRHTFTYDHVFSEECTNARVYESCCLPLIETVFSNGNATCFAYGQTGSGKTFTMLGSSTQPGLYAIAAREIFYRANKINAEVYVSLYEIYGRKIFDLLHNRERLVAREDADKVINICGLSEHRVTDIQEIFEVISQGSEYRAAGVTSANSESSRSHAVLQIEVREKKAQPARRALKTIGRISFIDLAGNERGADTFDCDRRTRMEGAEINKSLLALKECIRSLGKGKNHIPFRGSILTEVLRDSFVGNCRTTMIATISPAAYHCVNTLNTLRYTQRVKDLGSGPGGGVKVEQVAPEPSAARPRRVIAGRRRALDNAGNNNNNANPNANVNKSRPEWVSDFADVGTPPPALSVNSDAAAVGRERSGTAGVTGYDSHAVPSSAHVTTGAAGNGAHYANNNHNNVETNNSARLYGRRANDSNTTNSNSNNYTNAAQALPSASPAQLKSPMKRRTPLTRPSGTGDVVKIKDPKIATIVRSHIAALAISGEDEDEDDDEDDEDDEIEDVESLQVGGASHGTSNATRSTARTAAAGGAGNLPREEERQVMKVHAYVVDEIAKAEEKLVALHRRHIDTKMTGIKDEIRAIQSFEDSDAVDEYVSRVRALLERQKGDMDQILSMLAKISGMLKDEEDLSNTLSSSMRVKK